MTNEPDPNEVLPHHYYPEVVVPVELPQVHLSETSEDRRSLEAAQLFPLDAFEDAGLEYPQFEQCALAWPALDRDTQLAVIELASAPLEERRAAAELWNASRGDEVFGG